MEAEKRNSIMSFLAGGICAVAWWLVIIGWIDEIEYQGTRPANLIDPKNVSAGYNQTKINTVMQSCQYIWTMPSVAFLGLILLNTISNQKVKGDGFGMDGETMFARVWVFLGFLCLMVTMVAGIWVGIEGFIQSEELHANNLGAMLIAEGITMVVAGFLFKFGRDEDAWGAF